MDSFRGANSTLYEIAYSVLSLPTSDRVDPPAYLEDSTRDDTALNPASSPVLDYVSILSPASVEGSKHRLEISFLPLLLVSVGDSLISFQLSYLIQ